MHAGAYSDLTSSMKTPVLTSTPVTVEVATAFKLSLSDIDLQQSGYFYYAESGGTLTITGYQTETGSCPGGAVVIPAAINGMPVAGIGDWAFSFCGGLTSVTIPDSVTRIGDSAFTSCSGLTSVTIPASVISIGTGPFAGCSRLTSLVVDPGNPNYSSQDGVIYNKAKTALIQYPAGKPGGFTIPTQCDKQ